MTIDLSVLSTLEKERGIALEELFALVENALPAGVPGNTITSPEVSFI